jgi:hypothetical protein
MFRSTQSPASSFDRGYLIGGNAVKRPLGTLDDERSSENDEDEDEDKEEDRYSLRVLRSGSQPVEKSSSGRSENSRAKRARTPRK